MLHPLVYEAAVCWGEGSIFVSVSLVGSDVAICVVAVWVAEKFNKITNILHGRVNYSAVRHNLYTWYCTFDLHLDKIID